MNNLKDIHFEKKFRSFAFVIEDGYLLSDKKDLSSINHFYKKLLFIKNYFINKKIQELSIYNNELLQTLIKPSLKKKTDGNAHGKVFIKGYQLVNQEEVEVTDQLLPLNIDFSNTVNQQYDTFTFKVYQHYDTKSLAVNRLIVQAKQIKRLCKEQRLQNKLVNNTSYYDYIVLLSSKFRLTGLDLTKAAYSELIHYNKRFDTIDSQFLDQIVTQYYLRQRRYGARH